MQVLLNDGAYTKTKLLEDEENQILTKDKKGKAMLLVLKNALVVSK